MKKLSLLLNLVVFLVVGCSKSQSISGDHGAASALENKTFFESVGAVKPLYPNFEYADKMSTCIYADTQEKSCKISEFPLLGMNKNKITVQDILNRTLISHDFLGETWKQVLLRMKPEMLQMFGSVSAIVISDKVKPSFYYSVASTIYLSGSYFWRNYDEWAIVSKAKDFREGSALPFQFNDYSNYIVDGKSISSRADQNTQSYDEISLKLARLLFHELSHANDFFPPSLYRNAMDTSKTFQEVASDRYDHDQIASLKQSKVSSSVLLHIGQVLYQEEKALPSDSLTLADEVVEEFKKDVASDMYAYSTPMEDLAMLSEEALMLHYYNASRFVFVTKLPKAFFVPTEDYKQQIFWGEKNRVAESNIKGRAVFAVENSLGKVIAQKVGDKLDQTLPKEIPANTPWADAFKL